jgi:protein SMG6
LGDLARYRELHSQKSKKNYGRAEGFYHEALAVVPSYGNPHNQLAVLATYTEAWCVAVYRYCRSLLTAHPFATSRENLDLLFEKSRSKTSTPFRPVTDVATLTGQSPAEASETLKVFLLYSIRLHGSLVLHATHSSLPDGQTPSEEYSPSLQSLVSGQLKALLEAEAIGDALLLKLCVICIFTMVRSREAASRDPQRGQGVCDRSVELAFETMGQVAQHVSSREVAFTDVSRFSSVRLLGPLAVFCDFLEGHPAFLFLQPEATGAFLEPLARVLNQLKRLLDASEQLYVSTWRGQVASLKERVELRGFLPLERQSSTPSRPEGGGGPLPDKVANVVRSWSLVSFGEALVAGLSVEGASRLLALSEDGFTTHVVSEEIPSPPPPPPDVEMTEEEEDEEEEVIVFRPSFQTSQRSNDVWARPSGEEVGKPVFGEGLSLGMTDWSTPVSSLPSLTADSLFYDKGGLGGWCALGGYSDEIHSEAYPQLDILADLNAIDDEANLYKRAESRYVSRGVSGYDPV